MQGGADCIIVARLLGWQSKVMQGSDFGQGRRKPQKLRFCNCKIATLRPRQCLDYSAHKVDRNYRLDEGLGEGLGKYKLPRK